MAVNIQTIKEFRKYLKEELKNLYPDNEIDSIASLVIEKITGRSRIQQIAGNDDPLSPWLTEKLTAVAAELKSGKPVQYILGETVFYGCLIKVNDSTLIPRQETEELVELVIRENRGCSGVITDLGTGSGCIAIALKKNLSEAKVHAIEISEKAIETAKENSKINSCEISFIKADILKIPVNTVPLSDIFVSNPPYVTESEKKSMHMNVQGFEPHSALFVPDNDPLLYYRAIASLASSRLKSGGRIYLEINEAMPEKVTDLLKETGFTDIAAIDDIHGKKRIIKASYNG